VTATYSMKVAQEILGKANVLNKYVVVKKKGVFPSKAIQSPMQDGPEVPVDMESKERLLLRWRPARVMTNANGSQSINDTPMLPPEFSGRELAAFMLTGVGSLVADSFGNWEDGPDHDRLESLDEDSGARQAIDDAFAAYRLAVARVGQPDRELAARMYETQRAYRKARADAMQRHFLSAVPQAMAGDSDERRYDLDAEYQRRLALVEADIKMLEAEMKSIEEANLSAEQAWLRAMVAELLKPTEEPAESFLQTEVIDLSLLADPAQLIKAFGPFTKMNVSWFDKWKDNPVLSGAIKRKGTSGRGRSTPPLFCPFLVMQGLMKMPRKGSNRHAFTNDETPWRMLKQHFPRVYEKHQGQSPLDD
jgi:hypothetical protein